MPQVTPFTEDAFASALANEHTSKELVKSKNHFRYFKKYLGEINAKTILIEEGYISKDFLHDYASYYSLCFEKYDKRCKRVHFFALDFDASTFEKMLEGHHVDRDIPGSYLGFIVVKPIPYTLIGYSLLKVYSNSPITRHFWGTKIYEVHLYGWKLKVDSLAFQEQDTVLSACATTAIWTMLSKASDYRLALIKSPNEITKDSGILSHDGSRLFPNKGLDIRQICQAIYLSGLVTEVLQADLILPDNIPPQRQPLHPFKKVVSKSYLKKILNAYSSIGIPLILVIGVPNGRTYGLHAISVPGFKQSPPAPIATTPAISYWSDNIEKFYAHDDQWGPFVRIEWHNDFEMVTEWNDGTRRTYVLQIVIPTFPKIRISYHDIEVIVLGLDRILTTIFGSSTVQDLVWDIRIDYSERYKQDIIELDPKVFPNKLKHLQMQLPKYVWIVTCYIGDKTALKFVFDATGLSQAMLGLDVLSFLPQEITDSLITFLDANQTNSAVVDVFGHTANEEYYQFFLKSLRA